MKPAFAIDVATPIDLRAMGAQPAGPEARAIQEIAASLAGGLGLPPPKIYVSKTIARTCLPASSDPPTLVIGDRYDTMDPAHMEMMAGLLPRGQYLYCAKGSHMALYDDQETYFAGLIDFLQNLPPRS